MTRADELRGLMAKGMVVAPGAFECITARLVRQAGFPAVYMTGAGTAATCGYPDYGLVTMTEMVENVARIAAVVDAPVIADADTGYGNELNAYRTVKAYAQAGAAALHIEDQTFPKKCGHLENKELVPLEDFVAKIRAAADARGKHGPLVIARTDSRAGAGFEEAVRRSNAALAAGADVAFLEAPQTPEEVAAVPKLVKGPCLLNVVRGGKTPDIDLNKAAADGYKIAIVPALLMMSIIGACDAALSELKRTNKHPAPLADIPIREMFRRFGSEDWEPLRERYRDGGARRDAAE
ncbi:MAG: isocitrate lyase/PEP mutase family protein [Alphaproteobacteria bacterium]|nr:isocitrate lyase/PEP mutase family protein [Alphaproteobacteria bacterium]